MHCLFSVFIMTNEMIKNASLGLHYSADMSARILLNVLNELRKRDKMRGLSNILSLFRNEFNKFNYTEPRISDSIYQKTLRLL